MFSISPKTDGRDLVAVQEYVNQKIVKFTKVPVIDTSHLRHELGLNDHQIRDICMSLQLHFEGLGSSLTHDLKKWHTPLQIATCIYNRHQGTESSHGGVNVMQLFFNKAA